MVDQIPVVDEWVSKPEAWVFDLDGTLAHRGDRDPYDCTHAMRDSLDHTVAELFYQLTYEGAFDGIIVTGRQEKDRAVTEAWLDRYLTEPYLLLMRPTGDNRPDHVVKRELYERQIAPRYTVVGVFDDRDSVVAMWRDLGLKCFQVQEGDF